MLSTIKEFREFFLRNTQVLTGSKPDKEINYPLQYFANINGSLIQVYNRFLKDNIPSEDVFSKFLNSLTFKLNPEDTATETEQGLVSAATLNEVIAGTDLDSKSFALYVKPSYLKSILSRIITLDTANYRHIGSSSGTIIYTGTIPALTMSSGSIKSYAKLEFLFTFDLATIAPSNRNITIDFNTLFQIKIYNNLVTANKYKLEVEMYQKSTDILVLYKILQAGTPGSLIEEGVLTVPSANNITAIPFNIIAINDNPETNINLTCNLVKIESIK